MNVGILSSLCLILFSGVKCWSNEEELDGYTEPRNDLHSTASRGLGTSENDIDERLKDVESADDMLLATKQALSMRHSWIFSSFYTKENVDKLRARADELIAEDRKNYENGMLPKWLNEKYNEIDKDLDELYRGLESTSRS